MPSLREPSRTSSLMEEPFFLWEEQNPNSIWDGQKYILTKTGATWTGSFILDRTPKSDYQKLFFLFYLIGVNWWFSPLKKKKKTKKEKIPIQLCWTPAEITVQIMVSRSPGEDLGGVWSTLVGLRQDVFCCRWSHLFFSFSALAFCWHAVGSHRN